MSKLTLDEAIKHCLDIADGQDKCAEISVSEHAKERISQCAADHRQLAEWLTELKELKAADAQIKKSQWQPPIMGQGKCSTYCRRCFGTVMRNATGMFEETPFCPHCGADMRNE